MTQHDMDARSLAELSIEERLLCHVLCEICRSLREVLSPGCASTEGKAEQREEEEQRREQEEAVAALLSQSRASELTELTPQQRHLLAQLRLFSALASPDRPDYLEPDALKDATSCAATAKRLADRKSKPPTVNLTTEGLAAPSSTFDALLTLASGVVQVLTGFHALGGIAAILHGVCRIASPGSPLTTIASTIRKVLTPHVTVIQESVKMMAPLPDNERSGMRDALCLAAHEFTGLEFGALKHQLFEPKGTELGPATRLPTPGTALRTPTELNDGTCRTPGPRPRRPTIRRTNWKPAKPPTQVVPDDPLPAFDSGHALDDCTAELSLPDTTPPDSDRIDGLFDRGF
ncbi:hypothetical protein [Streptomyces sp. NPDC046862]|uniref:hypothetical protein n=1 Tax=Streptomyces sp. NPDC046862 TaxID=3154603 RepID=UPI0034544828